MDAREPSDTSKPALKAVDNAVPQGKDFGRARRAWSGLASKLLVLTIVFVMIAEVLIFVPSVANFRNVWLQARLDTAEAASIVFLDNSDPMLSDKAQRELLEATGSLAIAVLDGPMRQLMAASDEMAGSIDAHYDLSRLRPVESVTSAFSLLVSGEEGVYRVFAPMKSRSAVLELVQRDGPLRQAILTYSRNVLLLSLAISLITATLVMAALYLIIVRPIQRLSGNMDAFSAEPDNAALILEPSQRGDEIGIAERRLASFERDLHATLRQRRHLADLGLAVSKINHDLRNILASAQLFSDRISQLPDPTVQRVAPKLLRSINRAVEYTRSVLDYGSAVEAPPQRRLHSVHAIAEEVAELLGLDQHDAINWDNRIDTDLWAEIDAEQMFRVLLNLCRNAVQAMERCVRSGLADECRLVVAAETTDGSLRLRVIDTGPGIEDRLQHDLFKAFKGSATPGGTGLGLAIAGELVRAHGGRITLETTSPRGTVFAIFLPCQHQTGVDAARTA